MVVVFQSSWLLALSNVAYPQAVRIATSLYLLLSSYPSSHGIYGGTTLQFSRQMFALENNVRMRSSDCTRRETFKFLVRSSCVAALCHRPGYLVEL